jgi:DNA polymerase III alpha subunit
MFSDEINKYHLQEAREIAIAGVVKECKIRSGKGENAGKYAFLVVVDPYGSIDISVFDSSILNKQVKLLDPGELVFCTATIRNDAQGQRILLRTIKPLMHAIEEFIPSFRIFITKVEAAEIIYKKIQEELTKDERNLRISIVAICPDGSKVQFNSDKEINVTHEFIADVMNMDGVEVSEKDIPK